MPSPRSAHFKARADRIRRYIEDPSIGTDSVEEFLDAAHALSLHRRRNLAIRKLRPAEQRERLIDAAGRSDDPFARLHKRVEAPSPDLQQRRRSSPTKTCCCSSVTTIARWPDWQRDLLTIVDEEARYFIPQIETKIMNEGWASFWHHGS